MSGARRLLIVGCLVSVWSCGGDGPSDIDGSITVTLLVTAIGPALNHDYYAPEGFAVEIDGVDIGTASGLTSDVPLRVDLEEGQHTLEIVNVPVACTVDGSNPRSFAVSNESDEIAVAILCDVELRGQDIVLTLIGQDQPDGVFSHVSFVGSDGSDFVALSGSDLPEMDHHLFRGAFMATVSPDGSQLTFQHGGELFVADLDLSSPMQLTAVTDPDTLDFVTHPAWSPDGSSIAYTVWHFDGDGFEGDVYSVDLATGIHTNISNDPAVDLWPSWSADGSEVAFGSNRDGGVWKIFVAGSDGSDPTPLTAGSTGGDLGAAWSPDGSQIAIVVGDGGGLAGVGTRIDIVLADGTGRVALTPDDGSTGPAWSPDGSRIAFTKSNVPCELWIMNADGSSPILALDALPLAIGYQELECGGADWGAIP